MSAHPLTVRLLPESRLRSRAARGSDAAFAAAYERHHQALYRYCRSIVQNDQDAQDALQNAFTRAFAALQTEQRDFDLRPWLFRIAHNEAITVVRQRRGTAVLDDDTQVAGALEDHVAGREELRLLRADLADLPERQRAALVLRELSGLSHEEIGRVLDLSPAGVKQALFDARNALWSARDGRALACDDVRRKLSDGDGRVLRGRGVRAHLRSCVICQGFRAELASRPQRLRLLAPPLPAAGAASLLSPLLGGTAAKLLACVALAGGGTTVAAVQAHSSRVPAREGTSVERVAATATASPVTSAHVPDRPAAASGSPVAGATERAAPDRPRRRVRENEPTTSVPTAKQTPAPSRTAVEKPSSAAPPAETTPPAETAPPTMPVEAPAIGIPAADRVQDDPVSLGTDRSESATPPGQAKKQQPIPARTNPGKAVGKPSTPPAANPGNGNRGGNDNRNDSGSTHENGTAGPPVRADAPGNSGTAPGHSGTAPGHSGTAPGLTGDTGGNGSADPGAASNGNAGGNGNGNGNGAKARGDAKPEPPGNSGKPDRSA